MNYENNNSVNLLSNRNTEFKTLPLELQSSKEGEGMMLYSEQPNTASCETLSVSGENCLNVQLNLNYAEIGDVRNRPINNCLNSIGDNSLGKSSCGDADEYSHTFTSILALW